jgi:hypothetical protein
MYRAARRLGGHRDQERRSSFLTSPFRPHRPSHLNPKQRLSIGALLIALVLASAAWVSTQRDSAWAGTLSLLPDNAVPATITDPDTLPVELGMRFRVSSPSEAVGVQFYKGPENTGRHTATLWSSTGRSLARVTFTQESRSGLQQAQFSKPVTLTTGSDYVISYTANVGRYSVDEQFFTRTVSNGPLSAQPDAGVYTYRTGTFPTRTYAASNYAVDVVVRLTKGRDQSDRGPGLRPSPSSTPTPSQASTPSPSVTATPTETATPTPSSSPTPTPTPTHTATPTTSGTPTPSSTPSPTQTASTTPGDWPGKANTGVPSGTTLTPYTGPCTITSTQTIVGVDATTKCDAILVKAPNVTLSKSLLPRVDATDGGSSSVTLTDVTVQAGSWSDGAIWGYNITADRVNVSGGQHSVHCASNCTITNSWLHDQYNPSGQSYHNNAFISNGGSQMVVRHNTLHCSALLNSTGGGCSGDLSLFGDFDSISDVTVAGNLFVANNNSISYCLYGGHDPGKRYGSNPTYIRVTDNVFQRGANQKCGVYGAVTSFATGGTGNVWSNNTWDDGGTVNP